MSQLVPITGTPWRVAIGGQVSADTEAGDALENARAQLIGPPGGAFERWLALYRKQFPKSWDTLRDRPDLSWSKRDGSIAFSNIPGDAQPYSLVVTRPGYQPRTLPVLVPLDPGPFQMVLVRLAPVNAVTPNDLTSSSSSSADSPGPERPARSKGSKRS